MIYQAIDQIKSELQAYVTDADTNPPSHLSVQIGNIGEILATNNHGDDQDIIISLINIEENRISRDPRNFIRNGLDIKMKNPAVHLNLFLLFTSVKHETAYPFALKNIQHVIEFFQQKSVFDHSNSANLDAGIDKLLLEMMSLGFEQLQQLWSMLGGKYHPSVMYKMRMVTIDSVTDADGQLVKEIDTDFYLK